MREGDPERGAHVREPDALQTQATTRHLLRADPREAHVREAKLAREHAENPLLELGVVGGDEATTARVLEDVPPNDVERGGRGDILPAQVMKV